MGLKQCHVAEVVTTDWTRVMSVRSWRYLVQMLIVDVSLESVAVMVSVGAEWT